MSGAKTAILPGRLDGEDIDRAMQDAAEALRDWPLSVMICGAVEVTTGGEMNISVSLAGLPVAPIHWLAVAGATLDRARTAMEECACQNCDANLVRVRASIAALSLIADRGSLH